jgi:hypothetical protein
MANPDPEIEYNCYQAQEVILYGDWRSDYPNQWIMF